MSTFLVALDFTAITDRLLQAARGLAKPGDHLVLLHVAAPEPDFVPYSAGPHSVRNVVAEELREEHRHLLSLVQTLQAEGFEAEGHMTQGMTVDTIVAEASRIAADLVFAGTHGHGKLHELLVGSTTAGLLKKLSVPVVVVPPLPSQPA